MGRSSSRTDGDALWRCSHADRDCLRLKECPDWTLCRDGKSVLDRINQLTCVGFCLLWTVETKTTLRGQGMGRDGPLPVIWHHVASIYNSLRQAGARPARPRCTLKGTWACMCWHRCEYLDLLTAELCDLLTPGSPAKWHLKIPSRKRVKNAIWH